MTEINGITIPDEGTTTTYVPDPVGGHMYVVLTTIRVQVQTLDVFQTQLDAARARLAKAQADIEELTPQIETLKSFIEPVDTLNATSSPAVIK